MKQVLRAQIQQKLMPSSQLDIRTNNTIKKKKNKNNIVNTSQNIPNYKENNNGYNCDTLHRIGGKVPITI